MKKLLFAFAVVALGKNQKKENENGEKRVEGIGRVK